MKNVEIIKTEELFKGVIFDVKKDEIKLPNGIEAKREWVSMHKGASVIVPIDKDGKIIFVRQYRHPVRENILELPAGMIDQGEKPFDCAVRELQEETGFTSDKVTFLLSMNSSAGYSDEVLYLYIAEDLQKGEQHFDFDEIIDLEYYTFEESISMITTGKVHDGKTIVGIFAAREFLENRK